MNEIRETFDQGDYVVEVVVKRDDRRMGAESVTVRRASENVPFVTSVVLRQLRVAELVRRAVHKGVEVRLEPFERKSNRVDEELMNEVARTYRHALSVGANPSKAVSVRFNVARSSAARWVTFARRRGYLGAAPGPRISGEVA
jgi:hypothetical protein